MKPKRWRNDRDMGCWTTDGDGWSCDILYDVTCVNTAQFYEIYVDGFALFRSCHIEMPMREAKRLVADEIRVLVPAMLDVQSKRNRARKGK